jgi:hypothetical protein
MCEYEHVLGKKNIDLDILCENGTMPLEENKISQNIVTP